MNKMTQKMNATMISAFVHYLAEEEKSKATIEKYSRDVRAFYTSLSTTQHVDKEVVIAYKKSICERYSPASVNSMLASLNHFFVFTGWENCRVKTLKMQKRTFAEPERELSRGEYAQLLAAASRGRHEQIHLVMETICSTGIRVSELSYITVEAAKTGRAVVNCKGKRRVVFMPPKLQKKLMQYARSNRMQEGVIFLGKSGQPLNRTRIWAAMKALCKDAGVACGKVFPHNLRHLFARCHYQLERDIVRLADILGHSDINTTRIYTQESGVVHERQVARLNLVT